MKYPYGLTDTYRQEGTSCPICVQFKCLQQMIHKRNILYTYPISRHTLFHGTAHEIRHASYSQHQKFSIDGSEMELWATFLIRSMLKQVRGGYTQNYMQQKPREEQDGGKQAFGNEDYRETLTRGFAPYVAKGKNGTTY